MENNEWESSTYNGLTINCRYRIFIIWTYLYPTRDNMGHMKHAHESSSWSSGNDKRDINVAIELPSNMMLCYYIDDN